MKASLQRLYCNQILTVDDMFKFCQENLSKNINFFHISSSQVTETECSLINRFEEASLLIGTQKFHRFVPISETKIKAFELSSDEPELGEERTIIKSKQHTVTEICNPTTGNYVICVYDNIKYVGLVLSENEEFDDFEIDFLYPPNANENYYFPQTKDVCFVSSDKVLGILSTPSLKAGTARIQYVFNKKEIRNFFLASH